jgi:hypothetical protein
MILTDERTQYTKYVKTPTAPDGHEDYEVAIWFTPGQNILTNTASAIWGFAGYGYWIKFFNQHGPAMSKRMAQTLFLEGIFSPGETNVACKKDDMSLFEGGRYIDTYARPVPAKFMAILPNGVAVYFYPWIDIDQDPNNPTLGQYAEYSVRHPEQVGRDTQTQRDTISNLPNLRGDPIAVVSDDRHQLLVTKQAIYQIGFNGGVQLHPVAGGRGLRGVNVETSTAGALWYSDSGVVWLRSGQLALLDKRLGFSDWFDDLTSTEREAVVVGAADSMNQVMAFVTDGSSGQRAMVYDHAHNSASEFTLGGSGTVNYAANYCANDESQLWAFQTATALAYPGTTYADSGGSYESLVECWINDDLDRPKEIREFLIDLGDRTGDIKVTVDGYRSGEPTESNSRLTMTKTYTVGTTESSAGRFRIHEFDGMRAKLFRITVTDDSGSFSWSVPRIHVEYEYPDEDGDGRSV